MAKNKVENGRLVRIPAQVRRTGFEVQGGACEYCRHYVTVDATTGRCTGTLKYGGPTPLVARNGSCTGFWVSEEVLRELDEKFPLPQLKERHAQ